MDYTSLTNIAQSMLALSRLTKRVIALTVDGSLSLFTLWLAFSLQLETWVIWEDNLWRVALTSIFLTSRFQNSSAAADRVLLRTV
jgi:hypothetical protein